MPAKSPMYLKTPTSKHGKKVKLRDVLSGDMISSPLGDLRHSAHVGPEGDRDMFGDVGFLEGKVDMLPALAHKPHPCPKSTDRQLNDLFDVRSKGLCSNLSSNHNSFLKCTISVPAFITHEQPPPKPPRIYLKENSYSQQQQNHHNQQQSSMSVCEEGVGHYREPCHDFTVSASIHILRHLVSSAGEFSEASSDDCMSEGCGPLAPKRGLNLDSDAGLSNDDLQSERESASLCPCMSRSESFAGLDLDLGPSILDDVLRIMDSYKS